MTMNILILHRIPYHKIDYHRGIDHELHDVTYFGKRELLDTLPCGLRHTRVERPGLTSSFEEAKAWLEQEPKHFDRVISLSEYELMDAALLREWLGVPGATVEQVTLVRDKVKMKHAVARDGLRVPRFLPLDIFLAQTFDKDWEGATVLKPRGGASSEDVVVFASAADARNAILNLHSGVAQLDTQANLAAREVFEVEEFITGPVLHFDGLVAQGKVLALTASRYVNTCLDYAKGEPLGSFHFPVTEVARIWVQQALNSVEIRNGSFHLEAIQSDGELVFLEVGNRVGGADVVATFELATGIHLPSQELRILLDNNFLPLVTNRATTELWHGWFVVPGHHLGGGYYKGIDRIGAFRHDSAVLRWNELAVGAPVPTYITYLAQEVPLAGIIATASAGESQIWLESLFASLATVSPPSSDMQEIKAFGANLTQAPR
jgi:hypothetical protein